jgi:hypothetical protein
MIPKDKLDKMDQCRHLLDVPAPEIVGELIEEIRSLTEQRDRLAEVMQQMRSSGDIVICSQSATNLTTNEL